MDGATWKLWGQAFLTYSKALGNQIADGAIYVGQKTKEVVSEYYGALNLWCFTNGEINPKEIIINYLEKHKEEF